MFNKNAKVEQLTKMFLSRGEEKGLIVKDPWKSFLCWNKFDIDDVVNSVFFIKLNVHDSNKDLY